MTIEWQGKKLEGKTLSQYLIYDKKQVYGHGHFFLVANPEEYSYARQVGKEPVVYTRWLEDPSNPKKKVGFCEWMHFAYIPYGQDILPNQTVVEEDIYGTFVSYVGEEIRYYDGIPGETHIERDETGKIKAAWRCDENGKVTGLNLFVDAAGHVNFGRHQNNELIQNDKQVRAGWKKRYENACFEQQLKNRLFRG